MDVDFLIDREISKDRLLLIPAAECCTDCLSS